MDKSLSSLTLNFHICGMRTLFPVPLTSKGRRGRLRSDELRAVQAGEALNTWE